MNRFCFLLGTAVLAALAGCQTKDNGGKAEDAAASQQVAADEPQPSTTDMLRSDTLRLGGHAYIITTDRRSDESLPRVKDENDVVFFDNTVSVSITDGGATIFEQTFSKADFESYVSESDRAMCVFQGMALDRDNSDAARICLGAQLGQPGLDGEGPAFNVFIPAGGGKARIEKVDKPFTTLDDMTGDED